MQKIKETQLVWKAVPDQTFWSLFFIIFLEEKTTETKISHIDIPTSAQASCSQRMEMRYDQLSSLEVLVCHAMSYEK
jgi:hypothetical protein